MAFLGMRGTGDWATNERPESWREGILYQWPNGDAPLTAIMSMLDSEEATDPHIHWWTKSLPQQGGDVTNIYTDVGLSSAYTSGGSAGDTLYVKLAESVAEEIRVGHQVLLRDKSDYTLDVNAEVKTVEKNGASSYLAVELMEADDNSSSGDLSDCDYILIIGNVNAEGGQRPSSVQYDPTEYENLTQILRTPMDLTRTALKTRLRTEDARNKTKTETLEYHSIELEKAIIWSILRNATGANGKPKRSMDGIISFVNQYSSSTVSDYVSDSSYSGDTWLQGGEDWLDEQLEIVFRYGSDEKLAIVGSGTMLGINRLAKAGANIDLKPMSTSYGLRVVRWDTPFGTIFMKRHPLFSYEETNRNSMLILEPTNLRWVYIDDTKFIPQDTVQGDAGVDGTEEEYLTEATIELHHPNEFAYLNGFNQTNTA